MTIWTRTSAIALAAALVAAPALAADLPPKPEASVAEEEQQANRLPDEPELAAGEATWDNRGTFTNKAGEAVEFWKEKVSDLDAGTVRLDEMRDQLSELEESHASLREADEESWQSERNAFAEDLMAVREFYAELPQGRKSEAAVPPAEAAGEGPTSQD